MSPPKPLDPLLGRRQTEQDLGLKRLHLVPLCVLQCLSTGVNVPPGWNVYADDRDLVRGEVAEDGMVRRSDGRMERES